MTEEKKVKVIRGIGVSPGITMGSAYRFDRESIEAVKYVHIDDEAIEADVERFRSALQLSRDQLRNVKKKILDEGKGQDHIRIIDAHLMILKDQMLVKDTVNLIRSERVNAEWAVKKVLQDLLEFFETIDDEYLRERSADIQHIVNRVLMNLLGKRRDRISDIEEPSIVVAHDLAPTDTAQMTKGMVLGFITDVGGKTSHTAIMARSLEIPAVVGLDGVTGIIATGDRVIIDGTTGTVIVNPSDNVIEAYNRRKERYEEYGEALHKYKDLPAETTDGLKVDILGNIEIVEEITPLVEHGAEGIGLYRTEFLYLNRDDTPTEDEHFEAYRKILSIMGDNPVTVRTLDIGGDKIATSMDMPEEINPAMGLRAVRFSLKRTDIFKTQLRGLLRASYHGKVKILFPMISGLDELRRCKSILEETMEELTASDIPFDRDIEVGAMIEIPSAAIISDMIAKEVDFMSIGTNDLLQYTLAIDRVNEHVAYLYEPFHPAVLRMLKAVAESAGREGVSLSVCGEMAGEPEYALILLGFGITTLSMNAFSILKVKKFLRSLSMEEAQKVCERILEFSTAREVESYLVRVVSGLYEEEAWA